MAQPPVALVTWANKGIGLEIARQLAAAGATVWLAAREEARGQASAQALAEGGGDVRFVQLDVTDPASGSRAATEVGADGGRLDVLVNNAGIQNDRPAADVADVDKIVETYGTNVFGVIRVTQALLPLLKASPSGRIVMLSSELGPLGAQMNPSSAYYGGHPARLRLVQGRAERGRSGLRQGA